MEVLFLGTCACDFSEKLNTLYKDCFDKDARRSSSMLVGGRILFDCGPHTLDSLKIANIDQSQITDLIVTHLHDDHFDLQNVQKLTENRDKPLRVWVREDAEVSLPLAEVKKMAMHKRYDGEGFFITGVGANHDEVTCPQHLFLEFGGKKIFYGMDGGWFLNKTYEFLRQKRLDLAVFDCTVGDYVGDYRAFEHNSIPMVRQLVSSFKTLGVLDSDSLVYLSHIAPSLHAPHEKTREIVREFGANLAYDGLKINL